MNEMWASEVERRLRAISDRLGTLNQESLRLQGQQNFGFPVTGPAGGDTDVEIIWIRLTAKTVIGGVNTYAWRRQTYAAFGGGMAWVDTGEAGTAFDNPAVGLNNDDRSISDGRRYPAKYNTDTGQWIFFLTLSESTSPPGYYEPPGPGIPYPFGWTSLKITATFDDSIAISPDRYMQWFPSFNERLHAANGVARQLYAPANSGSILDMSGYSGPFGTAGPVNGMLHFTNGYYSGLPAPPFGQGRYALSAPNVDATTIDGTWNHSTLSFIVAGRTSSTNFAEMGFLHVGMAGKTITGTTTVTGRAGFNVTPNDPIPYDGYNPFCRFGTSGEVTVDATLIVWVKNNSGIDIYYDEHPATLKYEWSTVVFGEEFVAGGTPGSLPGDFFAGGTPGSLTQDFATGSGSYGFVPGGIPGSLSPGLVSGGTPGSLPDDYIEGDAE